MCRGNAIPHKHRITPFIPNVYRAVLNACGWGDPDTLDATLQALQGREEHERAAALAVWYGEIERAVLCLQNGAEALRKAHVVELTNDTRSRIETLELLSMSVAGFGFSVGSSSTSSIVWRTACSNLLNRLTQQATATNNKYRVFYVQSLLRFLLSIATAAQDDSTDGFVPVLEDGNTDHGSPYSTNNQGNGSSNDHPHGSDSASSLSLCDKIAFACRYFSRERLRSELRDILVASQQTGNLEGLAVSGITKGGIEILQAYVDATGDVQTAALVTSRVILPKDWKWEIDICTEWLTSYRSLLNTWRMWSARANFDVDRGDHRRRINGRRNRPNYHHLPSGAAGFLRRNISNPHRRDSPPKASSAKASSSSVYTAHAALSARCNYCSYPLSGTDYREAASNKWLSKMKPVIGCCPRCRKPLPRCSICLLTLGCPNPFVKLQEMSTAKASDPFSSSTQSSTAASLPFGEWFTWCMRCKHGGHAHHLAGWFATNDTCPVSGCNCRCQFDGMEQLG